MKNQNPAIGQKHGDIEDSVRCLSLSARTANCLSYAHIQTVAQLDNIPDTILLKIPNMGPSGIQELRAEVDRYLIRPPSEKQSDRHNARHKLPKDPAFSRAWNAVEEMGGAQLTAQNIRNDWRCLLEQPMLGPKGVAHILVALEFFGFLSCEEVIGSGAKRHWAEIRCVREKFPMLVPPSSG